MKIIYHHRTLAEDAQGVHIKEMVNAFRKIGHTVDVVSIVTKNENEYGNEKKGFWQYCKQYFPVCLLELLQIFYNFYGFIILFKKIKKINPDLIYERYTLNTFCGVLAAKIFRIPIILEVNAPLFYEQKLFEKLCFYSMASWLEHWIWANSTKTITVSTPLKHILLEEGIHEEQVVVISNAVNPLRFHKDLKGDSTRNSLALNKKIVLGFVGWFKDWHKINILLEIFAENMVDKKDMHMLLVGDGPAFSSLKDFVEKSNIENSVTFTGQIPVEEISRYIATFDIALQLSATPYASPMKIFEYMAMGKAIIAPRQANIQEILTDGFNAVLFEPNDKQNLAACILKLVDNPEYRNFLGINASETIYQKEYLWEKNAEKIMDMVLKGTNKSKVFYESESF